MEVYLESYVWDIYICYWKETLFSCDLFNGTFTQAQYLHCLLTEQLCNSMNNIEGLVCKLDINM